LIAQPTGQTGNHRHRSVQPEGKDQCPSLFGVGRLLSGDFAAADRQARTGIGHSAVAAVGRVESAEAVKTTVVAAGREGWAGGRRVMRNLGVDPMVNLKRTF